MYVSFFLDYNSSTLRKQFAGNLTKESIRSIYDLCHYQDRPRLNEHLGNVRSSNGTPHELTYRLRLGGPDVYVHVKTQSKLFRCTKPNETDFIMAICTVLTENEVAMLSADSGAMAMGVGGSSSGGLSAAMSGSNINNNNGNSSSSSNPTSSSSSLGLLMPSTSGAVTGGGLNGSNDVVARHMAQITQGVSNMGGPLMSSVLNGGGGSTVGTGSNASGMLGGGGMTGGSMSVAGGGMAGPGGTTPGSAGGSGLGGGGGMGAGAGGMGPSAGSMGSIVSPRSNPNSSSLLCGPNSDSSNFFNTEFELDFPHSTFDMEAVGVGWDSRPDSRTSVTPVSTPRPPSVSAYSPAAAPMCASPMTPYYSGSTMGGMPSPSNNNNGVPGGGGGGGGSSGSSGGGLMNPSLSLNNNNNNTNNNNTGTPFGTNAFQFPFEDSKDKLQDLQQQQQQQQQQQHHHPHMSPMQQHQSAMSAQQQQMVQRQQHHQQQQQQQHLQQHLQQQSQPPSNTHDSERLRNLLTTKRPHSNASSSSGLDMDHDHRNPNRILKVCMMPYANISIAIRLYCYILTSVDYCRCLVALTRSSKYR